MEYPYILKKLNGVFRDDENTIEYLRKQLANEKQRADDAEANCKTLQETLEEAAAEAYAKKDGWEPKKDGWKPEPGKRYWYFTMKGRAEEWENEEHELNIYYIALGNCAPTEEELRAKEPEILAALGLEKWEE